jgi:hypothetical protein
LGTTLWAGSALAGDPFEIQVYDGTANGPGVAGLELHLNNWATGHRVAPPPESPLHGQWHATLEPSLGITPFWELGLYIQGAIRTDEGAVDWAGVKARSKFVTPPALGAHFRFGLNVELSYLPATYDANRFGSELRPIVAWQNREWLFAFNPILDQSFSGSGASLGPSFQPALKAWRTIGAVAVGFEYYATLGPLTAVLPAREEEHYVFEVIDLVGAPPFELNAGVGEGLTEASAGIIFKVILGYSFDEPPALPTGAVCRACAIRGRATPSQ